MDIIDLVIMHSHKKTSEKILNKQKLPNILIRKAVDNLPITSSKLIYLELSDGVSVH